jgi:hypothetical protein
MGVCLSGEPGRIPNDYDYVPCDLGSVLYFGIQPVAPPRRQIWEGSTTTRGDQAVYRPRPDYAPVGDAIPRHPADHGGLALPPERGGGSRIGRVAFGRHSLNHSRLSTPG